MILAAGRGQRLRPLTDYIPKPLLQVGGETLVGHHLRSLAKCGITRVVINTAWRSELLHHWLGDGSRWGVSLHYSDEGDRALETGGGILQALPLLGSEPFVLINGDVWSDFDPGSLQAPAGNDLAHLVLVENPPHNPDGDFGFKENRISAHGARLTYSGIAVLCPDLFAASTPGVFPLGPLLRSAAEAGRVGATFHRGAWFDTGTAAGLEAARLYTRETQ